MSEGVLRIQSWLSLSVAVGKNTEKSRDVSVFLLTITLKFNQLWILSTPSLIALLQVPTQL